MRMTRRGVVRMKRRAVIVRMKRRVVVRMKRRDVIVRGEMSMIFPRTMLILTTCSWTPSAQRKRRPFLKPLEDPSSIGGVFR